MTAVSFVAAASPAAAASVPTAPTIGTSVNVSSGVAMVTWSPPSSDGGSPITVFVVQSFYVLNGVLTYGPSAWALPTLTQHRVAGLSNGTKYWYGVRAVNAVGPSPMSKVTKPPVVAGQPNPPANINVTMGASCTFAGRAGALVTVTWTTPSGLPPESYGIDFTTMTGDGVTISTPTLSLSPSTLSDEQCLANGGEVVRMFSSANGILSAAVTISFTLP
jgi:hypothetical protein